MLFFDCCLKNKTTLELLKEVTLKDKLCWHVADPATVVASTSVPLSSSENSLITDFWVSVSSLKLRSAPLSLSQRSEAYFGLSQMYMSPD